MSHKKRIESHYWWKPSRLTCLLLTLESLYIPIKGSEGSCLIWRRASMIFRSSWQTEIRWFTSIESHACSRVWPWRYSIKMNVSPPSMDHPKTCGTGISSNWPIAKRLWASEIFTSVPHLTRRFLFRKTRAGVCPEGFALRTFLVDVEKSPATDGSSGTGLSSGVRANLVWRRRLTPVPRVGRVRDNEI